MTMPNASTNSTKSNSAMHDAMQTALSKNKEATAPTYHRPVVVVESTTTEEQPEKNTIPRDSILRMRYNTERRFVPMIGHDGRIMPTLGWMIDLLGLEYININTKTGRHLVILRNEHYLRDGEGVGEMYHIYVPDGSTTAFTSLDMKGGTPTQIRDEIERRNENFDFVVMTDELDRAFAINDVKYMEAWKSISEIPDLRRRCIEWHKQDIAHGMNNFH